MSKFKRITAIALSFIMILSMGATVALAASNDYSISTPYYRIGTKKRLDIYTDSKMAGCGTPYIQLGTSLLAPYAEVTLKVQDLTNGKTNTVKMRRGCKLYLDLNHRYYITDTSAQVTSIIPYDWKLTGTYRVSRIDC
ncbi:MAG: hypothetical protein LBN99_04695 [Oscillospiraceae bacterium]|jgi:hypothetical protein|nr:hypothetical protein [Oscillospiraceae bacterium]